MSLVVVLLGRVILLECKPPIDTGCFPHFFCVCVCASRYVCLSSDLWKMAEQIWIPFGIVGWVGPRMCYVWVGVLIAPH